MQTLSPDTAGEWLGLLVNATVLFGGLAAAYKFRVFDVLGHKYRSEVWCTSTPTGAGAGRRILFVGNYVIHNTGSRPLRISRVRLRLLDPHPDQEVIDSGRSEPIVAREFTTDAGSSWFKVGAGERSIFPLRCWLDELPTPVLMECTFHWKHRGEPSEFVWLYDPRLPTTWWSEPTPGLPDAYDPARSGPDAQPANAPAAAPGRPEPPSG